MDMDQQALALRVEISRRNAQAAAPARNDLAGPAWPLDGTATDQPRARLLTNT